MTEDSLQLAFDTVYKAAQSEHNAGQYGKAKRDYYKAAEYMTQLASLSGDRLKAARVDRAKRILAIADSLPQSERPKQPKPKRTAPSDKPSDAETAFAAAAIPDVTFADVMGLDAAKDAIRIKMIYPMSHADVYAALGKSSGGGILLYGPPGTGKTLLA